MFGKLFVHASSYSLASVLVTAAGFISFPILTRIFSVDQYGTMSLISSTLLLVTVLGKLGMQHSIVRFYAEIRAGKRAANEARFLSTIVFGMGSVALIVTLVWVAVSQLIPASWWNDPNVPALFLLSGALIFIRVMDSAFSNLLRAQERSGWLSIYSVVKRYAALIIVLATVLFVLPGLFGFYAGMLIAELASTGVLAFLLLRKSKLSHRNVSPELIRAMAIFGLPMIAYEFAGVVLNVGDRYVIQATLGAEPLGAYAAAYNMCEYIQAMLVVSFTQALTPMYLRLWEQHGAEQTRAFVQKTLHFYAMFAIAVVAGLSAVGGDLLGVLASTKYAAGAVVVPWIIAGMIMDGAIPIIAAGLFIGKQTKVLMILVVMAAALNIGLNVALVPEYGITGAAAATLISYFVLAAGASIAGARTLKVRLSIGDLIKFSICGLVMYFAVQQVQLQSAWMAITIKVLVGVTVYASLVLLADRTSRAMLAAAATRFRSAP